MGTGRVDDYKQMFFSLFVICMCLQVFTLLRVPGPYIALRKVYFSYLSACVSTCIYIITKTFLRCYNYLSLILF